MMYLKAACLFSFICSAVASYSSEDVHDQFLIHPDTESGAHKPCLLANKLYDFTLRHIYNHGVHEHFGLHQRMEAHSHSVISGEVNQNKISVHPEILHARSQSIRIERLANRDQENIHSILRTPHKTGSSHSTYDSTWISSDIPGPNVSDKETVLSFAKMAANAYLKEAPGYWENVGSAFNDSGSFGWNNDSLRGHVFADNDNSTIVISFKGTSFPWLSDTETAPKDRLNDNLFASCCCGQGGQYFWRQVCSCQTSAYTCNSTCLDHKLKQKAQYYWAALEIYYNITSRYPGTNVWLTGHSLGGVVASLLGLTFGSPTVTFEAYPAALAASRLGLPIPPGYAAASHQRRKYTGIYHFGHTADPVFMGSCNSWASSCTLAGYAFQSQCHTGQTCVYDTVGDLGWRVNINTHRILNVIDQVLLPYETVANCTQEIDCVDCYEWNFVQGNETGGTSSWASTVSRTSMTTGTSTRTCATPGRWGCLDPTSTADVRASSTMSIVISPV